MQLILQSTSGHSSGRRVYLRNGQLAQIGRTDWADFSFPDDESMEDIHFAVRCSHTGCVVRKTSPSAQVLVNGEDVNEALLSDGDVIVAGRTQFHVHIEGQAREDNTQEDSHEGQAKERQDEDLVAVCEHLELDEQIIQIAAATESREDLMDNLVADGLYPAAIRLQSHWLTTRQAVWWGTTCLRAALGDAVDEMVPEQQAALHAAERWVMEPTELYRRSADMAAEATGIQGPACYLALAAFWSEGSLAPEDFEPVVPDHRLTGKAVAASLMMIAYQGTHEAVAQRFSDFLQYAREIDGGKRPWPKNDESADTERQFALAT